MLTLRCVHVTLGKFVMKMCAGRSHAQFSQKLVPVYWRISRQFLPLSPCVLLTHVNKSHDLKFISGLAVFCVTSSRC